MFSRLEPIVIPFILGAAGTLVLTPLALFVAWRLRALDVPDGRRKLHNGPIPLLGGAALLAALVAGVGLLAASRWGQLGDLSLPVALLATASLLCVLGCWDDLCGLRAHWKLIGQLVATLPLLAAGYTIESIDLGPQALHLGVFGIPLTMAWLVAGINAVNLLDGADGLASLVGITVGGGIASVAMSHGQFDVAQLSVLAVGGLCGFLAFNAPPARIYLGDAGSMTIGAFVAALGLEVSRNASGAVAPAVPLILLAVPLFDAVLAIVRRVLDGVPIWHADRGHIHHRLLDRGLGVWEVNGLLVGICLITSLAAYLSAVSGQQLPPLAMVCLLFVGLLHGQFWAHNEWVRLRQHVTRTLLELVVRHWRGPFVRHLPTPDALAEMTLEESWQSMIEATRRFGVVRIELAVGDGHGAGWRRDWGPHPSSLLGAPETIETRFVESDGGWCKLRAFLQARPAMHPVHWLTLFAALSLFGRHWAVHPDLASPPTTQLRILAHADDDAQRDFDGDREVHAA